MLKKIFLAILLLTACDQADVNKAKSSSGISKVSVKIPIGADGLTAEQRNISERLKNDNDPGAIKHLYVISAYSGQVLIYSTVKGKVTSGGKRLTPTSVVENQYSDGFNVKIGDNVHRTTEVLQDDGTYGSSSDYLYWWDTNGVYHQHYVQGGQIVHISDQPLSVPGVVINMQVVGKDAPDLVKQEATSVKSK